MRIILENLTLTSFKRRGMASWIKFTSLMQKVGVISITCFMLIPSKSNITTVPYIFKKRIVFLFFLFFFFFFIRNDKVWERRFFFLFIEVKKEEIQFSRFQLQFAILRNHELGKQHYKLYNYESFIMKTRRMPRSFYFIWNTPEFLAPVWQTRGSDRTIETTGRCWQRMYSTFFHNSWWESFSLCDPSLWSRSLCRA